MEDVGYGEIVAEGGDDKGDGGENDESENNDAGAAGGLAQPLPQRLAPKEEGNKADTERIDAQRQCEEQGKTTNLRHVGEPQFIFSETASAGNRNRKNRTPEGHRPNGLAEIAAENCEPRTKRKIDDRAHVHRKRGGRGSAARRLPERADPTRFADGSVDESRAPQSASLRLRGLAQIRAARRAR